MVAVCKLTQFSVHTFNGALTLMSKCLICIIGKAHLGSRCSFSCSQAESDSQYMAETCMLLRWFCRFCCRGWCAKLAHQGGLLCP